MPQGRFLSCLLSAFFCGTNILLGVYSWAIGRHNVAWFDFGVAMLMLANIYYLVTKDRADERDDTDSDSGPTS